MNYLCFLCDGVYKLVNSIIHIDILYDAGGSSRSCPENAGAAGTLYDSVPCSLTISNNHKTTYTDTLLLDFPQPFLTNVNIRDQAKAAVPLLWSRVMVSEC